jgi:outer membrane translocation and assembly module TamA
VSNLRSVRETLIGSDGTAATLRGYPNLRFRGDHLLLLQAEYRFGVWGPVDATIFVDAGKAVDDRSQLNLSALNKDAGFSVSFMHAAATIARADVGFGSEGPRIFISLGGLLP